MSDACPLCGYRFSSPRARCGNRKACDRRQALAAPVRPSRPDTYLVGGLQWTPGPRESRRCTQTVLMQFGIMDRIPKNGLGMLEAFTNHGFTYRALGLTDLRMSVRRFVAEHPTGRYYLVTRGHALALIDGLLVDSAERGPDGRILIAGFRIGEAA